VPAVLVLHVKRYIHHGPGGAVRIANPVSAPLVLDLPEQQARYNLRAAIFHRGKDAHSGHYTSVVRRADRWWLCDDKTVTAAELHADRLEAPQQPAQAYSTVLYMAFYERE